MIKWTEEEEEITNQIGTYIYCVCKVVFEDSACFGGPLCPGCFIELWPLNNTLEGLLLPLLACLAPTVEGGQVSRGG